MSITEGEMTGKIKVEVIGPACYFCKRLYLQVGEIVAEQGIHVDNVHVTNLKTVLRYSPFTPVLKVNDQIVHKGKWLPKKEKLLESIGSVV
jgi:hypothetical protein